jgi:hypothetical protein
MLMTRRHGSRRFSIKIVSAGGEARSYQPAQRVAAL